MALVAAVEGNGSSSVSPSLAGHEDGATTFSFASSVLLNFISWLIHCRRCARLSGYISKRTTTRLDDELAPRFPLPSALRTRLSPPYFRSALRLDTERCRCARATKSGKRSSQSLHLNRSNSRTVRARTEKKVLVHTHKTNYESTQDSARKKRAAQKEAKRKQK